MRELLGEAITSVEILGAIVILFFVHFLFTKFKKVLITPFVVMFLGYIAFIIGIVYIRGWTGMGWIVWGNIIMAIGILFYLGLQIFSIFRKRAYKWKSAE
jgi:predicted membrane channel-forming protein YqfA (hemolysin III family)